MAEDRAEEFVCCIRTHQASYALHVLSAAKEWRSAFIYKQSEAHRTGAVPAL
jgi:hypothetical protein